MSRWYEGLYNAGPLLTVVSYPLKVMSVAGWNLNAAKKCQIEREMLSCCYCDSPLEAVMLETNAKTGEQRLLWACRNMRKQKCFFPIGLPSEIFFLKRSAVEKEEGVIPRPNIRLLPRKYWGLYPTVFADELRARSQASTRTGTSMSDHTTDHYSCPANSPTTSGSSVPSDHAAVDQLLKMGSGTSIWEDSPSRPKRARIASFSSGASSSERGDSNMSVAADSSSTFSSTDASERSSGSALAELICDRLQYTGVDIGRLEDDELVSQMAGVVKKLHKEKPSRGKYPGNFTHVAYHASLEYLFNLDVTPIKRKLNVSSTDLTRAVAVMRSKCDIDTMLNAMGGSTPAANPPAKRSRPVPSKQELKKRVEAILKKLATRGNISEKPTSTIVANTVAEEDPTGAQEWYEGEDGPSISNSPVPHTDSASAEEERLNAVVQTKVRSYIAKAAARRHEMRRIRIQQSSFQTAQPQAQTLEPSLPHQSITLASSENFNEQDGLLSFDSPYAEHLGEDSSTHSVHPEDLIQHSHTSFVQDLSISDTTHSHNPLLGSLDLHSPVGDDEFHSLFGEYDFI